MPNAVLAEWLIARVTDHGRAASAVGDLLELAPERGSFWFWSCIAGIILSLIWRRLLAFAIAYLSLALVNALSFPVLAPLRETLTAHNFGDNWSSFLALSVAASSAFVADAAAYVAICYGLRDELTRLLLLLFTVCLTATFLWRMPELVSATLLAILILSIVSLRRRRALLAAALALGIGFCGFWLILYLWPWYLQLVPLSATGYSLSSDSLPLLSAAIQAAACDWAHWLVLDRSPRVLGTYCMSRSHDHGSDS
jgi:hypothetical protein